MIYKYWHQMFVLVYFGMGNKTKFSYYCTTLSIIKINFWLMSKM